MNNCNKSINDVENAKIACTAITSASSVSTAAASAATLLAIPGVPGPPGVSGIQGVPGNNGRDGKDEKDGIDGSQGDSYFTQIANNVIYNKGYMFIEDPLGDKIISLSHLQNSYSDFYCPTEFHQGITVDGDITNTNLTNTINTINNNLNPLISNNVVLGAVGASTNLTINGASINIGSSLSNVFINGNLSLNGGLFYRASTGYSNAVSMAEYISQF